MKKLMKKTALAATAFALALMVALSLSGSLALPAAANSGIEIGTSTPTAIPTPESGGVTDATCESPNPNPGGIDTDCDGLIEIATFAQLNAIRYDTANGNVGFADKVAWEDAYRQAFGANPSSGCPIPPNSDNKPVCVGYELVADIAMTGTWTPIGGWATMLDGNGHVISGMRVTVTSSHGGMFSGVSGKIRNLGLRDADVTLNNGGKAGILAGGNGGEIQTSYATDSKITYAGVARGADADFRGPRADVGGLVGRNNGKIIGSWADVDILLDTEGARAGGLVGSQKGYGRYATANAAKIVGSFAYGDIEVTTPGFGRVGGFIGVNMNLNEHEHNGKSEITDIRESYAYGKVIPNLKEGLSWSASHPNTKTGDFGCNATPAELIDVYYNDESASGGCSKLAGRTSP